MVTIEANTSAGPPKLQTNTSTTQLINEGNDDYDELPPVALNKTSLSDTPR